MSNAWKGPVIASSYGISFKDPMTVQHVTFTRPHPRRPSETQRRVFAFTRRDSGPLRLIDDPSGYAIPLATAGGPESPIRPGRKADPAEVPAAIAALSAWRSGDTETAATFLTQIMGLRS